MAPSDRATPSARRRLDPASLRVAVAVPFAVYLCGAVADAFLAGRLRVEPALSLLDAFAAAGFAAAAFYAARRAPRFPLGEILLALLAIAALRAAGILALLLLSAKADPAPLLPARLGLAHGAQLAAALAAAAVGRRGGAVAVFTREVTALFRSPATYVVLAAFSALAAFLFDAPRPLGSSAGAPSLGPAFVRLAGLVCFAGPIFALRYAAAMARRGPDPYHGAPVQPGQILAGRYGAALLASLALILSTVPLPLGLAEAGRASLAPVLWGYLGLALVAAAATAFGFFAGAVSSTPMAAAGGVVAIALLVIELHGRAAQLDPGPLREAVRLLSLTDPVARLAAGHVSLGDLAYYVSLAGLGLFWTLRWEEGRRWA